ncbi:hypothetical protein FQA47_001801 [Oryzias melastigma]|uniref:Uncharacterized protein n=1 Tax=Oryzias melastigma TaxID=30732 RepID=A0A834FMM5_ORYME|nr:hypothetical protein FQA47_001801 [Oryzias melastigma]
MKLCRLGMKMSYVKKNPPQVFGSSQLRRSADGQRLAEGRLCFHGGRAGIRTGDPPTSPVASPAVPVPGADSRALLWWLCQRLHAYWTVKDGFGFPEASWVCGAGRTSAPDVWGAERHSRTFTCGLLGSRRWNAKPSAWRRRARIRSLIFP